MSIKSGDAVPEVTLKHKTANGISDISTKELFSGKKVVLFAVPGAFTPTCSAKHLPGFVTKYNELKAEFGELSVSVEPIDITLYQSQQNIKKFRKANPGAEGKVFFDVASGKGVKLVKDVETGDLKFIPADSSDIDTSGEDMPAPNTNPGLFGQETKPGKPLKEILPDFTEPGFNEDFYQS